MNQKLQFLIIDEDKEFQDTLKQVIEKLFPESLVFKVEDSEYALKFVNKNKNPSVIICDYDVPGLNGVQLLQRIKSNAYHSSSHFVLIAPKSFDKDQTMKALKLGCDSILKRPLKIEQIVMNLRVAASAIEKENIIIEKDNIVTKLEKDLKESSQKLTDMAIKIQQSRLTERKGIFEKIKSSAVWILRAANEFASKKEVENIETASSLVYVGKMFLPDKNLYDPVMVKGFAKNEMMEKVPKFAKELIEGIKGFEEITKILYHLFENYDGSGIPEKIQGWEIPLGSRILRVCVEYEEFLIAHRDNSNKAMEELDHESKRLYDFKIVALYDQYLAETAADRKSGSETAIDSDELKPGHIMSRNIITSSGTKLISSGAALNDEKIKKINNIVKSDPIIGKIWIRSR